MAKKTKDISGIDDSPKEINKPKGKHYLLTIAIDNYEHVPKLSNCVKDAKDFIQVLQTQYQFSSENTFTLFDNQCNRSNIFKTLTKLAKLVGANDSLIVYYSGHGYYEKSQNEGYLIPVNSEKDACWDYLPNSSLLTLIRAIKSLHTFLIIDSCFSGSLFVKHRDSKTIAFEDRMSALPSRWAFAAGMIEKVSDGFHGENSPFAKSLITILKRNQKERLSVSELIFNTQRATANNAKQTPIGGPLYKVDDMDGQFVFYQKTKEEKPISEWTKIKSMPENTQSEIYQKTQAIEKFLAQNTNSPHEEEAFQVGEKLVYKMEFLKAQSNRFALMKFARKQTPFQAEAKKILENKTINPPPQEEIIDNKPTASSPSKEETIDSFTDVRDGQTYKTVKLKDGNIWMAENFNFNVGKECWHHDNNPENGKIYGRLYTWEAALKACPKGWHLPSEEEWENLIEQYGGIRNKDAYNSLIKGGSHSFAALLGGSRHSNGEFFNLHKNGNYWSATENETANAWGYHFFSESGNVIARDSNHKWWCFSCRYIKNKKVERKVSPKNKLISKPEKIIQPTLHIIKDSNTFTDPRDGQNYKTVQLKDGKTWLAQNFNFDVGNGCWFYDDNALNGKEYGRLYTWEAAQKACPEGWHLPSEEELKNMFEYYGDGIFYPGAYQKLIKGGKSQFDAVLGGARGLNDGYSLLGSIGLYWNATTTSQKDNARGYSFEGGEFRGVFGLVRLDTRHKLVGCSCRYVKNKSGKGKIFPKNQLTTEPKKIIQPTPHIIKDSNTFTDSRDGQTYKTVKLKDGKTWMAQNLNFDIGDDCWFYENDSKNGEEYGRLYTWEVAKKACPEGWHLPSDKEWENMINKYGGLGAKAYKKLIKEGEDEFSVLLGGRRSSYGEFSYLGKYGSYWSATEGTADLTWGYSFYSGNGKVTRNNDYYKSVGLSCRCVQD